MAETDTAVDRHRVPDRALQTEAKQGKILQATIGRLPDVGNRQDVLGTRRLPAWIASEAVIDR